MIARLALLSLTAAVLTGCSNKPPPIVAVTGIVTLDGKPLPFAEVKFIPQAEGLDYDFIARAVTDKDGRYTLLTKGQPGCCACECRVTVSEASPPEEARSPDKFDKYKQSLGRPPGGIPIKYANTSNNAIIITVTADKSEYPLELKSN